jgi:hypothetical protein
MLPLTAIRGSAWALYGVGLASGALDVASWLVHDDGGPPNPLFMVAAVLGANAAWHVGDVLARQAAELAALREALSRVRV